jgi:integrase
MNQDMASILKARIERSKSDSDLLFNTKTWAIKNFSKYCVKAGVREIHFHSLRHTCLTNLANGYGMDAPLPLPQVQKIAGHKDIGTTMRYVHVDGIDNTTSRQWSREERRALRAQTSLPKASNAPQSVGVVSAPRAAPEPQPAAASTIPFRVIAGGRS